MMLSDREQFENKLKVAWINLHFMRFAELIFPSIPGRVTRKKEPLKSLKHQRLRGFFENGEQFEEQYRFFYLSAIL